MQKNSIYLAGSQKNLGSMPSLLKMIETGKEN